MGIPYEYRDVEEDEKALQEMVKLSKGVRKVPVILDKGEVKIGFGGT